MRASAPSLRNSGASSRICWRTCATNWGLARTRRQPSRGPDVPSLAGGQAIPGARRQAPRRRRFRLPLRRGQASYQANGQAVSSPRAGRPCRDGEDRGRERPLHKERSAVYAIEYGGRKLVTSDPGDGVGYPVPMRTPLGRSLPARRLTCDLLPRLCGSLHLAYPDAHAPRAGPSSPQKMSTFGCAPFSLARHGIKASLSASKRFLRSHLTRGWGYEGVPDGLRRSTS
jgi:hypothetical protein